MSFRIQELTLPPGCKNTQNFGTLIIIPQSIRMFEMVSKSVQYSIRMWGLETKSPKFNLKQQCIYSIKAHPSLFRQYLSDAKVSSVIIYDTRNNQELGIALINWQLYLSPIRRNKDQISYPLAAEELQIQIPVVNYRKKKIAQVSIKIVYKKYVAPRLSECAQNSMNFDLETSKQINQPNMQVVSINNKQGSVIQQQPNIKHPEQASQIKLKKKISQGIQTPSIFKNEVNYQPEYISSKQPQIKNMKDDYEVELALLKMTAKGLISENLYKVEDKKSCLVVVRDFTPSKPNMVIEYLEINIWDGGECLNKMRVFPIKNYKFNSEFRASEGQKVEMLIPKTMKGSFYLQRDIGEVKIVSIFNQKNYKVGHISLDVIREKYAKSPDKPINNNINKIQHKFQQSLLHSDQDISHKSPSKQISNFKVQSPIDTFLLVKLKSLKHYYILEPKAYIQDCQFSFPLPSTNIIPHSSVDKTMNLQIRDQKNMSVASTRLPTHKNINIHPEVVDCVMVFDNRVEIRECYVDLQVYVGTIKQVNYRLRKNLNKQKSVPQQKKQFSNSEYREEYSHHPTNKKIQEKSSINQYKGNYIFEDKYARKRKLYTEVQRLQTEPISEYEKGNPTLKQDFKPQDQYSQEQDPIYLVEVFTRFLHALRMVKFEQQQTKSYNRNDFQAMIHEQLVTKQDQDLADIVLDIFTENEQIEYEEFIRCHRSYQNFVELWWRLRVEALIELVESDSQWEESMEKYSELGTINRQVFWRRVFPKTKTELKLKIQKFYHITSEAPINTQTLMADLKRVKADPDKLPQILTPELITELGKLIRQTIQNNVGSDVNFIETNQEKVNIKILCDIFETINISLSYWESLMVIQELKSWYNIDYDLGEGILSSNTVNVWIGSVIRRRISLENSQLSSNRTQKSMVMSEAQKLIEKAKIKQKNKSQVLRKEEASKTPLSKLHENRSGVRSQLNEDEIMNIANLLRQNDNFRMPTISSQSKHMLDHNNNFNKQQILPQRILNTETYNNSSIQLKHSPPKFLHVTIQALKLKQHLNTTIAKIQLVLFKDNSHYFFIKQTEQAANKQFMQIIKDNWQRETAGLQIFVKNCEREEKIMAYGIIPTDDINISSKTVMLYHNSQIIGRLILKINITNEKPNIHLVDQEQTIHLKVEQVNKLSNFSIMLLDEEQTSIIKKFGHVPAQGQKIQLKLPSNFYRNCLKFEFEDSQCIVPLEEIYMKAMVKGQYPLITEDGHYISTIQVTLFNNNNIIQKAANNQIPAMSASNNPTIKQQPDKKSTNFIIIADYIYTIDTRNIQTELPQSLYGHLVVKNALSRQIKQKFDCEVDHTIRNVFQSTCLFSEDHRNYIIMQVSDQNKITIQFEYNGRPIARSIEYIEISANVTSRLILYPLKFGDRELRVSLGLRILQIPSSFHRYKFDRIFKAVARLPFCDIGTTQQFSNQKLSEASLIKLRKQTNLTITQLKLLQQLINLNSLSNCQYNRLLNKFYSSEQLLQSLTSEFLINDPAESGSLPLTRIKQILMQVLLHHREYKLYENIQSMRNQRNIDQKQNIPTKQILQTEIGLYLHDVFDDTNQFCSYEIILLNISGVISSSHQNNTESISRIQSKSINKSTAMLKEVSQLCERITQKYHKTNKVK